MSRPMEAVAVRRRGVQATAALVIIAAMLGQALAITRAANPDPNLERDLIALTNVDRTSNGLSSVVEDTRLIAIARERSDDMLIRDYFSHGIPPTGERVFGIISARGIVYEIAGENLAWNNAKRDASVQFAEQSFMNSPGHRANILRDAFTTIGVGAIPGVGKIMYTVLFMKPAEVAAQIAPEIAPAPPPEESAQLPAEIAQVEEEEFIEAASPFEFVIDQVIGRSLNIPGAE